MVMLVGCSFMVYDMILLKSFQKYENFTAVALYIFFLQSSETFYTASDKNRGGRYISCSVNIDRVARTLENVREIDFVHGEALESGPCSEASLAEKASER